MLATSAVIPPARPVWHPGCLRPVAVRGPSLRTAATRCCSTGTGPWSTTSRTTATRPWSSRSRRRQGCERLRDAGRPVGVIQPVRGRPRQLIAPGRLRRSIDGSTNSLGPFDTWQYWSRTAMRTVAAVANRAGHGRPRRPALGVAPADCVVVGDIGADIQAALRAGARAVLVPTAATRAAEVAHARTSAAVADTVTGAVRYALAGRR